MSEEWDSYFCKVNNVLASIFLNLGLRKIIPDKNKPHLLWVRVYMKWPREDGLSSSSEFEMLCSIDDQLEKTLTLDFNAVFCGRITTDGRREFYYYAPRWEQLEAAVASTMKQFQDYEFDCGWQPDPNWTQYLEVLYPSEEDRQRMENRKVLEVLERKGDKLQRPRDVWHWIYFRTDADREQFLAAATAMQYRLQSRPNGKDMEYPNGLCIVRFQSVKSSEIDDAVIELFRLAKTHQGDYDGWETQVISD